MDRGACPLVGYSPWGPRRVRNNLGAKQQKQQHLGLYAKKKKRLSGLEIREAEEINKRYCEAEQAIPKDSSR